MPINEDDRKRREDKANSYRQMMELWAWKDFEAYLDTLRASMVNDFIAFEATEAVEFKAGQYKGALDCLNRIKKELEFIITP